MHKSHIIHINPTKSQLAFFRQSAGTARFTYNWALNRWNELYAQGEKTSAFSLIKELTKIKREEFPWMMNVGKCSPQYAIHNLETAKKNYFRGLKDGSIEKKKKAYIKSRAIKGLPIDDAKLRDIGKPNFKKKGYCVDSFIAVENNIVFQQKDFKIKIPRLGWVKCSENLRFEGKVNNVTVKRIADRWFAIINIETNYLPKETSSASENQAVVGVDLGIKSMAVLSDGTVFENPKALKKGLRNLKHQQRSLSRKVKGSNNRYKQQMKVAKVHYRISCIRKNAIHLATTDIVRRFDKIVIEDLAVCNMVKNHKLSQALSDVSFGEFRRQLDYKSKWAGKELVVADRYFASSKTCSGCGFKKESLLLSERIFCCDVCGLKIDRDLNAAINLANYSPTSRFEGSKACGDGSSANINSFSLSVKHEVNKLSLT